MAQERLTYAAKRRVGLRTMRAPIVGHGLVECLATTAVSLLEAFVRVSGYYGIASLVRAHGAEGRDVDRESLPRSQ